jgi:hypothetical protein
MSEFKLTAGENCVTRYESGAGYRVFCGRCGSPLWFEPAGLPHYLGIPLGVLDGDDAPSPKMHVWMSSKVSWVQIADGLPQHKTYP